MGAFFHAVAVFFHHLADVSWGALGLALLCHVIKLLFRARAWQNIIRASYPKNTLKFRAAAGAYIAGVGVNSIAPARGGDLVKLYLVKHRVEEATYPTLASTLQSVAGSQVSSISAPLMEALPALVRNGATPAGAGPR